MEKIDLFCGISSLGMPFPRENKYHIGYSDILKNYLIDQGYEINNMNISCLNNNHTWDLEKVLNCNYSLAKIKNIQFHSIDDLRNVNALFKLIIPKQFKKRYLATPHNNEITLREIYANSQNPLFIYSGGPNDFFSYIKAGPVELMNKEVRSKLPSDLEKLVIKCIDNIEKNWILLNKLNPNVKIYALSFYYSPLFDKIQSVIFLQEKMMDSKKKYSNRFKEIINLYNYLLEEIAKKYEFVKYIDLTSINSYCAPMDFHPNTQGNQMIAEKILESFDDENHKLKY